jgi:tetratricopeptide (TPR) repeat protein
VTSDTAVELSRAGTMIELGRYDEAAGLLASVVAAAPDAPRAWCLLSRAHLGAGRGAEAVLAARQAATLNPADDWPHRLESTALVSLGRGHEALAAAAEARRLAPGFWRSHVCLAQAAVAAGDQDPAVAAEAAAAALAIAPDEPDVHFTAGKVALSAGDLSRAREHQQAALAIDPRHAGATNELGRISLRERNAGSAAGYFLRAARAAPGVGIFGRNTEVALAKVLTNITVPVALVIAVGIDLPILTGAPRLPFVIMMAVLTALTLGYAAHQVRMLPSDGRRHLARMLRRRRWLLTIAAIIGIVVILATFAALVLNLVKSGNSVLLPCTIVIVAVAARALVTMVIRRSRRNIR